MPTYDYRCPNGHQFEVFQRISVDPGAECPECGQDSERMISGGAGFIFKGEGFYITDYRSEDYKKRASSESGGEASKSESGSGETRDVPSKTDAGAANGNSKTGTESSGSGSPHSKSDS